MNDFALSLMILGFFAVVVGIPAILTVFGFSLFRKKNDELDEEDPDKVNKQKRSLFFYFKHFIVFTILSSIVVITLLFPLLDSLPTEFGIIILVSISLVCGYICALLYIKMKH